MNVNRRVSLELFFCLTNTVRIRTRKKKMNTHSNVRGKSYNSDWYVDYAEPHKTQTVNVTANTLYSSVCELNFIMFPS